MLDLYSASAGSGKTYTLAKKYIWYFITITDEEGRTRLRTDAELADSARHILAVTFTNKATNEMQMRIVAALFDLALLRKEEIVAPDGSVKIKNPDYLDDFCRELGVEEPDVARVCKSGLAVLLENYSDFNVSTIDSFFQQVLRTFAYESELNDAYQVELDSSYLSQIGVDATLAEIDANDKDLHTPFWVKTLMDRTEKGKWNIFARTTGSRLSNAENPYKDFINSVKKMENEEYKRLRRDIEQYFDRHGEDMVTLYEDLVESIEKPVREAFSKMQKKARKARRGLPDELKNAGSRSTLGKPALFYRRLLGETSASISWDMSPDHKDFPSPPENLYDQKAWRKWADKHADEEAEVVKSLDDVIESYDIWREKLGSGEFNNWKLYAVNLPFYALFSIVSRKRQEYLEENNAVELGETSMILKSVIGDSDTPFIYERIGTYLNHFLIDEFQDTSAMQWEILSPLVHESMGRDNGNLIIGDAKQSIYRFRNADPSLITTTVPEEFAGRVMARGSVPEENTNYRSQLRVVQFNNSFFEYLAGAIDEDAAMSGAGRFCFGDLYSNVVQRPDKKKEEGYVEVRVSEGPAKEATAAVLAGLPELVARLVGRGYLQREIAVLVSTHGQGQEVIDAFVAYNASNPESGHIRFVSEQSLKVASSKAVRILVGVLENMARGSNPEIRTGDERLRYGVGNWADMMANFKYYAMSHQNLTLAECLDAYLEEGTDFNALSSLLKSMQSLAIPAIVEAVAAAFIPDSLRSSEAVYIAAFQDLVLEYCDSHPTDIGSFLKWWERKSESASIASPEDTDAVQVITVHKSKGLQYECVILPFASWDFADSIPAGKKEWRWVRPEVVKHPTLPLPDYIPVETSEAMRSSSHSGLLDEYFDQLKMDRLNAAYVAFTRAKKELYVFSNVEKSSGKGAPKGGRKIGRYLMDFLTGVSSRIPEKMTGGEADPRLPGNVVVIDSDPFVAMIGTPAVKVGEDRKQSGGMTLVDKYYSVETPSFLKYRADGLPGIADVAGEEDPDADDLDTRSEGTLKHAVLELVKVPEDLPDAIRHLCVTGVLPDSLAGQVEADLSKALSDPRVVSWFDGSARVLNERPVLKGGRMTRRPDRLLLYPDGTALVIDYKFGKVPDDNRHKKQVARYMRRLAETRRFSKVRGALWYVNCGEIVEVTP